jgi:hypothetical protein
MGKTTEAKKGSSSKRMNKGNLFLVYRRCEYCTNTKMWQTAMGQLKCTKCKHVYLR